ncbi:putative impB mucB samB family [Trypanosoma vivax]|nr:putative impB mucB samB family [Trypanosoma vivax]
MNARCLALQRGWYHGLKCLPFHCMVAAARFMSAGSSLAHRTSGNGFSILAETKAVKDNKNDKTADELLAEDPSIKLQPVDMKKLSLPLHTMEKIPEDVAANVLARDRSIVFSPLRKQSEVFRRLFRIKHSFSVQPLGNVVHFRFYSLDDVTRTGMPTDISAEKFLEIKEKLRAFTRFVVTDDRWPLELSLEVTQCIKKMEECSENEMESGSTTTKEDVVQLVSRVLSDELNVGAWCGLSCTPVLAKMACDACVASYTLRPVDLVSGGVVRQKCYDLKTHAELQNFMKELPLSEVPVLGPAQVRLLKDVFNVERCGQLAEIEERLCFTFSPQSTEFFLALAYGTMRLRGEVTTTLCGRCPAVRQLRCVGSRSLAVLFLTSSFLKLFQRSLTTCTRTLWCTTL